LRRPRPDAGFSIVLAVMTILILLVLGLALASMVTEDSDLALNHVQSNQAFYAAHAGVEYAVQKVGADWNWGGLAPPGKTVGAGSFWIAPPDTLDETGAPLPGGRRRIVSTGIVGSAQRQVQVQVTAGAISTYAGTGANGYSGDGGPAVDAVLKNPEGVFVDASGDLYVADTDNHVVRKISSATGIITTVAGDGHPGVTGDGGPATSARLSFPEDIYVTASGDLYIADTGNNEIRKVSGATGVITTVAGSGNPGSSGDGGPATSAKLKSPRGIIVAPNGDFYIGDRSNNKIRKVSGGTGIITTAAGTGSSGYSGDGGPATSARLSAPQGIALASNGDVYLTDTGNNVIRKIAASSGIISTVVGTGAAGSAGDGGPASAAQLRAPEALCFTATGDLLVADTGNHKIRRVTTGGVITTVAGTGTAGFSGDGGPATTAQLDTPRGVHISSSGVYYIGDHNNRRVRRVSGTLSVVAWVETRS
jgi:sugar lactone lactonase YvrE